MRRPTPTAIEIDRVEPTACPMLDAHSARERSIGDGGGGCVGEGRGDRSGSEAGTRTGIGTAADRPTDVPPHEGATTTKATT